MRDILCVCLCVCVFVCSVVREREREREGERWDGGGGDLFIRLAVHVFAYSCTSFFHRCRLGINAYFRI